MELEILRGALGWCAVINLTLLLWWFLMLVLARDLVRRIHSRWFSLPADRFDTIHYAGMGLFKMATFFFNVVPYIALRIVS